MRLMSTRAITGTAFAATMALSGFLLFQIQPILAKFILPWFGGSASTWLACALFFQLALLTGYALAFVLTRARHAVQTAIVVAALSLCLFLLPIAPADSWRPSGSGDPTLQVLGLLLACVGLPFVVLAMTTPLLSQWLANAAIGLAPLRFFVASNVGSFLGLLTYPFLIEYVLTSRAQAGAWSWMFIVYAGLCVLCAVLAGRMGSGASIESQIPRQATPREPVLAWVALAMLGSALMLATSNAMMQWSAVVPFLWVLPLSIYLLSFVVVFAGPKAYSRIACGIPFLVLAVSTPWLVPLPETTTGLLVRIAHSGATLFFGCMICHGELVARRPAEHRLPVFYLALAGGGALGGVIVVLLAPLVLNAYLEYVLSLAAVAAIVIASLPSGGSLVSLGTKTVSGIAGFMLAISFGWLVHQEAFASVEQIRNFYGVVKVVRTFDQGQAKLSMIQSGAEQGEQFEAIERRSEVTCGMDPGRGLALALAHHAKRRADGPTAPLRIGIVGLGVGMASGLGRPGDSIAYYEVNPAVHDLARRRFTFLRDSKAAITVSIGDGRLTLERELQALGSRQFDVLVLDAFRGTSPPLHLMTKEAFSTYLAHLAEDGILAVNMAFDTFNVAPLYRGLAKDLGVLVGWFAARSEDDYCDYAINWALFTKDARFFRSPIVRRGLSRWPDGDRSELVWTDASSNLLSIIIWGRN